jgi:hypothetical protein
MDDDEIIKFRQKEEKCNNIKILNQKQFSKFLFIIKNIIFILLLLSFFHLNKKINNSNDYTPTSIKEDNINNNDKIDLNLINDEDETKINEVIYEVKNCSDIDPINLFKKRLDNGPIEICKSKTTKHICYGNFNNTFNDIYAHKNGVICLMENIIINPLKSEQSGLYYKGPVDHIYLGFPILHQGFFNTKCKYNNILQNYNEIYNTYFNSWNYKYKENKKEKIEELAPGKTILFISRNQDSPNLYHGNSEIINVISMMDLFNLESKDIQIVFLESIVIPQDPFYDIYKYVISKGTEPLYIRNLKKKYKISKAIHVPINWDSPAYLNLDFPKCDKPTKTYQLYNDLVNKYLNLTKFKDSFIFNKNIFYYPKSIINELKHHQNFIKTVTIQWRQVWPKGRTGQFRILGNGKKLADKLASKLPKNILIRLIDTAKLPMNEQISIIRSTDYLVGIHGAGLSLSIFLPSKSILHEILHENNLKVLTMMSALSGHVTFSDIIMADVKNINDNEYVFFDANDFAEKVLNHLNEIHFFEN